MVPCAPSLLRTLMMGQSSSASSSTIFSLGRGKVVGCQNNNNFLRIFSSSSPRNNFSSSTSSLAAAPSAVEDKKTALYDYHLANGGKMVPFAGYLMPVQYSNLSIIDSHLHTRESCSVFDVSHMLQSEIRGKDRVSFMESLVVGDIGLLEKNQGTLTVFTNEKGGIIDDLIVNNVEDYLYVVSNAGCRHKDIPLMENAIQKFKAVGKDVSYYAREDLALLAVQGPKSAAILQPLVDKDLSSLYFMNTAAVRVCGFSHCRITRCGYTGEDGFEVSIPANKASAILDEILGSTVAKAELAGLGARDSLRLEAGLCLYGNDIDEDTTPVEAALTWLLGKTRKERQDFPGASKIMQQLKDKSTVKKKRVGFISRKGPPPRGHAIVLDPADPSNKTKIGEITSGCPSPSLGYNVAMGYVQVEAGANPPVGSGVKLQVRNQVVEAEFAKMPFIKGKYYNAPKK